MGVIILGEGMVGVIFSGEGTIPKSRKYLKSIKMLVVTLQNHKNAVIGDE